MNLQMKRLLKPGKTRWLFLQLAVNKILSLWDPLLQYFRHQIVEKLIEFMEDPEVKIYLQLMAIFLKKFNSHVLFKRENFCYSRIMVELCSEIILLIPISLFESGLRVDSVDFVEHWIIKRYIYYRWYNVLLINYCNRTQNQNCILCCCITPLKLIFCHKC